MRFFSIEPEEETSALLLVLYFFLAMACVGAVKSLQNSLYLINVGFDWKLPALFVGLALLGGPVVLIYQRMAKRASHSALLTWTLVFFLSTFLVLMLLLSYLRHSWIYFVLYAWGEIFRLLIPILGWVVSYDLYRIRAAKRLFGLLAAGGVLGGAFGSYCTVLAADHQGWLLLQILGMLAVLQGLLVRLCDLSGRRNPVARGAVSADSRPEGAPHPGAVRDLLDLPYVRCLGGIVLVAALATTLIDLNYLWFVRQRYGNDAAALKQLIGYVLTILYLASGVLQVFGTRRVLQRLGLPAVLLITPLSLGGASLVAAAFSRFWPSVAVRTLSGILGSSLQRTGVETLYVPLVSRYPVLPLKTFVELVVFKAGDASGAILFLIVYQAIPDAVRTALALQAAVVMLWLFLARRIGKEYIRHLRQSVQEGMAVQLTTAPEEGQAEEIVLQLLQSADPVKTRLGLLGLRQIDSRGEAVAPEFPLEGESLLQTKVSAFATRHARWPEAAASLLIHPSEEIGAAALHLLVRHDPVRQLKAIRERLDSEWAPEPVYLCYLDRYVEKPGRFLRPTNVLRWCQSLPSAQSAVMARLMGKSRDRAFLPVLRQWMQGEPGTRTLAAIEAVGPFGEPQLLPTLSAFLGPYWSCRAAHRSLASYGESAIPHLTGILQDPSGDPRIKREIPLVLGDIHCSSSRAALVGALYQPDPVVSHRALTALNRIRDSQELSFAGDTFLPVVEFWARQYSRLISLESVQESGGGSCAALLRRALQERKRSTLERIFRTLELFLPPGDAFYCYRVLAEHRIELRDHAIELIEAQLSPRLKEILLPIFTDSTVFAPDGAGRKSSGPSGAPDTVIAEALLENDPWFRCCLLAATRERLLGEEEAVSSLLASVLYCVNDISALVRETALWTLEGLRPRAAPPSD